MINNMHFYPGFWCKNWYEEFKLEYLDFQFTLIIVDENKN